MKIAYCIRNNWKTAHGGDVVQMLNTKSEIERSYNVEIRIVDNVSELGSFNPDIVHVFNMQTIEESRIYLNEAKKIGAKTVLSTIYWDMNHARFIVNMAKLGFFCQGENYKLIFKFYTLLERILANIFGKPKSLTQNFKDEVRHFLDGFDWYLPNSEEEMQIINSLFQTYYKNYTVIPNSVDFTKFPLKVNNERKGFICAARLEPIKNQLQIVDICKESNYDLTLVGGVTSDNMKFLSSIKKIALHDSEKIRLITQNITQSELGRLFNVHKVHVLASFRESPGLSSLEALSSGMNIVVSENAFCPTETYFNNVINKHVFLCDPYSKKSINKAMNNAMNSEVPIDNLIQKFNWFNTGKKTFEVYKKIMCQL